VKEFAQIRQMITEHAQILDARSAGRFIGTSPEPRPGISSGHMPGAISLPFTELVEEGRLKSAEKLRELFIAKNVDMHRPITTTCGSGITLLSSRSVSKSPAQKTLACMTAPGPNTPNSPKQ
jgi:thiosulfate/3-mercaptopyruvate sulfurtransferase